MNLDREQFQRVVVNLVDNAAEAMQDSLVKELYIATQPGAAETVELVFADSGCELLMGEAKFTAPKAFRVTLVSGGERMLDGDRVFLSVGSRASIPSVRRSTAKDGAMLGPAVLAIQRYVLDLQVIAVANMRHQLSIR